MAKIYRVIRIKLNQFKKMSIWSLTCQQSVFKRYHSDKHLSEFYLQDGGTKINWYRYWTIIRHCVTSLSPYVSEVTERRVHASRKTCPFSCRRNSRQVMSGLGVTQLDWKRVPNARSRGCKSSVAITGECSRHHASGNVSWPQRAPSVVLTLNIL